MRYSTSTYLSKCPCLVFKVEHYFIGHLLYCLCKHFGNVKIPPFSTFAEYYEIGKETKCPENEKFVLDEGVETL